MHILLIHQAFVALNEPGGTRHHEIARILAEKGNKVTIIASPISYLTGEKNKPNSQKLNTYSNITIFRTYTYPALHKSFFHRLISFFSFMVSSFLRSLYIKKVDVVWGTSPPIFQGFTAWLIARLKRVPFLFEVRDLWPAFAIAVGVLKNKFIIRISLWLEQFLYRHADQIIVNSPGFINHVRSRGGKRIGLIPNGSDASMFDPNADRQTIRKLHDLENKYIVLYAGAHGMSNDLEVILKAAQIIQQQKNIRIVLIGDGKEKQNLQTKADAMKLSNVSFIDPVPKIEMKEVLAAADVCIAILKPVDLYKTTYPNKVFDYMAAGRPIILAIDGVIREVVEEAGCGIYTTPGNVQEMANAITYLYKHKAIAKKMGLAGQELIQDKFDRTKLANQFIHIFEGMRNKNGGKRIIG
ncbi:MAG TPA: glycosyltransferase family 4 protein [Anaerolineae bacterium]|nr:glycosyltransferase family 4 protein [Anaerolineae bacterium]